MLKIAVVMRPEDRPSWTSMGYAAQTITPRWETRPSATTTEWHASLQSAI